MFNRQASRSSSSNGSVVVYGTNWCAETQKVRRYLDRLGIPYKYRNMERDPSAARQVQWWTGGSLSHPTVQIGGQILVEPSLSELNSILSRFGLSRFLPIIETQKYCQAYKHAPGILKF